MGSVLTPLLLGLRSLTETPPNPLKDVSLSPCCSPVPPTPRLSKFLPVPLLHPEPLPGHRTTPTVPTKPGHPPTSAAEAKAEQDQEGQQDEGLHGAFLGWAGHSSGSLGVFIGCCGLGKGGHGPSRVISSTSAMAGAAGRGGNCGLG